jgi:formate hydrogenlyase transcriptional activator
MDNVPVPTVETVVKRYEALLRMSASQTLQTPQDIAQKLANELHSLLDFDFFEALVFEQNTCEVLWRCMDMDQRPWLDERMEETPAWWVHQNQQRLIITDWDADDRFSWLRDGLREHGVEVCSICSLPLTTPQRSLGVLFVANRTYKEYSEEEIHFLSFLADGLAFALGNAFNYEASCRAQAELELQNSHQKLLLELTNRVASNLDLRELLRAISASVRQTMDCDMAGVSLLDSVSSQFQIYAIDSPDSRGFIQEESTAPVEGPIAIALETLRPVIKNSFSPAEPESTMYQRAVAEGIKSTCLVPLVSRGRALGILALGRRKESLFKEEDAEFLMQVGGQLALAIENALAYREIADLKDKLAQEKLYLEEEIRTDKNFEQIIGKSAPLRHVLQMVETVAPSDSTALLLGETGTGKELIARAIHDHSPRKGRTFVRINCAAIPAGLLESELFGHEKGAFTGAISQKIGRLELADQGTLFLDEVGDIPLEMQPKLLRVLQEREFERLGSTHTRKVNVRLVAATNRDLEAMIAAREFRSDLFYRLNVFPIHIPPLRERREDIPLLVRYFVEKFARRMQKRIDTIPAAAMKKLTGWEWPGNIRELENFIERAVILTRGKTLEVPLGEVRRALKDPLTSRSTPQQREEIARIVRETIGELNMSANSGSEYDKKPRREIVHTTRETANELNGGIVANRGTEYDEKRRQEITRILIETKGRVGGPHGAAARAGLHRTTLLSRMRKLGIDPKDYSS